MTMPATGKPEDRARANIDRLLTAAGWLIQNRNGINIEAGRGVAIREFQLARGHGFADYLLYIDGYAAGVVEAKKAGVPLVEVEIQSGKYSQGLPDNLPAPRRPLPFGYQSTGVETRFTNLLEPDARSGLPNLPEGGSCRWHPDEVRHQPRPNSLRISSCEIPPPPLSK